MEKEIIEKFGHILRVRPSGIVMQGNAVLLIKHASLNDEGIFWSPPGGGLNFGESIHSCLAREFLEETGLEVGVGKFIRLYEYLKAPLHAIELFFECTILSGTLKLGIDPELELDAQIIQEIKFIDLQALQLLPSNIVHPIFHGIKDVNQLLQSKRLL